MPKRKRNKSDKRFQNKIGANDGVKLAPHSPIQNKSEEFSNKTSSQTKQNKKHKIESTEKEENTPSSELNLGANFNVAPKSALQQAFLARLAGSRFRELNEQLYTTDSSVAFKRFQENPELFDQYHEGFRTQVKSWPVNPVDAVYKWILSIYRQKKITLNGSQLRVADFGCGDAKLAEKLLQIRQEGLGKHKSKKRPAIQDESKSPFHVHSFDLVANGNPLITPCDMSNVPIQNESVDIGVFVLALMGTNIKDFILEAHRVLTKNGILKIAEVRSRFEGSSHETESVKHNGKHKEGKSFHYSNKKSDDSLMKEFLEVMEKLGFRCTHKDRSNKMFFLLEFVKTGKRPDRNASFTAKPCIYKRR